MPLQHKTEEGKEVLAPALGSYGVPNSTAERKKSEEKAYIWFRQPQTNPSPRGYEVARHLARFSPNPPRKPRRLSKTRQAEAKLRRIANQYGAPLASALNLQKALPQGTMLYAAELTWSGCKGVEGEYQPALNRTRRSTLGAFISTPQGILAAGSSLAPARALLDHR